MAGSTLHRLRRTLVGRLGSSLPFARTINDRIALADVGFPFVKTIKDPVTGVVAIQGLDYEKIRNPGVIELPGPVGSQAIAELRSLLTKVPPMPHDNLETASRRQTSQIVDLGQEFTFAMIKSHAVRGDLVGDVCAFILRNGLSIVAAKQLNDGLTGEQILGLYGEHAKRPYWQALQKSVGGPVVIMILGGKHAVRRWRSLLGETNSMMAQAGTLRAMYGSRTTMADNVAHGSDGPEKAIYEIGLFFPRHIDLRRGTPDAYPPVRQDDRA